MSVGFSKPRNPEHVPQFTLWRMTKDGRIREARTRLVPFGDHRVELAIYESRSDGTLDLLWSQVLSGGEVNALAQQAQRESEVAGWKPIAGS